MNHRPSHSACVCVCIGLAQTLWITVHNACQLDRITLSHALCQSCFNVFWWPHKTPRPRWHQTEPSSLYTCLSLTSCSSTAVTLKRSPGGITTTTSHRESAGKNVNYICFFKNYFIILFATNAQQLHRNVYWVWSWHHCTLYITRLLLLCDGELAWLFLDIVSIYVCTFHCAPYNGCGLTTRINEYWCWWGKSLQYRKRWTSGNFRNTMCHACARK